MVVTMAPPAVKAAPAARRFAVTSLDRRAPS